MTLLLYKLENNKLLLKQQKIANLDANSNSTPVQTHAIGNCTSSASDSEFSNNSGAASRSKILSCLPSKTRLQNNRS